jgi:HEAT repeat protein
VADPSADPPRAVGRLVEALGAGLLPAIVRQWAADPGEAARGRLQALVAGSGDAGRRALRRLLGTGKDSADLRLAALTLLRMTGGSDLTSTFEECLSDSNPGIRGEAFQALASLATDRARDALATGIAGAPPDGQPVLIDQVVAMRREISVPILARLVRELDQATVPPKALGTVISALADAGTDDAARALLQIFRQSSWRSPHRALRYRMAAAAGLHRIGGPWSSAGLRALAGVPPAESASPPGGAGRTDTR